MNALARIRSKMAMALVILAVALGPGHVRWQDSTSPDVDPCARFACQG